jgi:hypothetical protein
VSALLDEAQAAFARVQKVLATPATKAKDVQDQEDAIAADAAIVVGNCLLSIATSLEALASHDPVELTGLRRVFPSG